MIEILQCEVDLLTDALSVVTELGVISEWGACNSDAPLVIIMGQDHLQGKYFLATQDDLVHSHDGVFVSLKDPENFSPIPEFDDVFELKVLGDNE